MIDYIVYGEFDDTEGTVVRIEYTKKTKVADIIPDYLIPEGAHNLIDTDKYCFVLSTPSQKESSLNSSLKITANQMKKSKSSRYFNLINNSFYKNQIQNKQFPLIECFELVTKPANSWKSMDMKTKSNDQTIYFRIAQDKKEKNFKFQIYTLKSQNNPNDINELLQIPIHEDIQFQKLDSDFISVYTINSQCIGFKFKNVEDVLLLYELFQQYKDFPVAYAKCEEDSLQSYLSDSSSIINNCNNNIYFLCCSQTKLDKSATRGAIWKSIAIGTTKLINLMSFESTVQYLLDKAFLIHQMKNKTQKDKNEIMLKVIENTYNAFNNLKYQFGVNVSRYERGLFSFINNNIVFTLPTTPKTEDIFIKDPFEGSSKITIDLSLSINEEKIFPSNLIEFILTFKEKTMIIYDAILKDMKILFIGNAQMVKKLSMCVFSTLSMVGPLAFGYINRLHPGSSLTNLDFLEKIPNCIYSVTNPIFREKKEWWDILCEVETGKIAISDKNKESGIINESDNNFIKELLQKIIYENISEYEVEKYFMQYTYHLLKFANRENFLDNDELKQEMNKQNKRIIKMKTCEIYRIENDYELVRNEFEYNTISLSMLERDVYFLYTRKNIEKEELGQIYSEIDKFIEGGEFYIKLFLGILSNYTYDFQHILNGIFSRHSEIKQIVRKIYNKICNDKIGSILMKRVNYLYLMKLNELEEKYENISQKMN